MSPFSDEGLFICLDCHYQTYSFTYCRDHEDATEHQMIMEDET